jgi:hypothetical protein
MPKSVRQVIESMDEIFWFMRQSHISEKNVARLEQMKSENPQVASLAAIVLKVARVKPYRTRRLKLLAQRHPELIQELEDAGLVPAQSWVQEAADSEISVEKHSERNDPSVEDDWAIPF